jgi:phosphoribosylformylglycinamidine synthase II
MLWEIDIFPVAEDAEHRRIVQELRERKLNATLLRTARVYLVAGNVSAADMERLALALLTDAVCERYAVFAAGRMPPMSELVARLNLHTNQSAGTVVTVLPRPEVMDPVIESVTLAARDLGLHNLEVLRTGRRYLFAEEMSPGFLQQLARKALANEVIEEVHIGTLPVSCWRALGRTYQFRRMEIPLRNAGPDELVQLSQERQLALSLEEMLAIQKHYRDLGREPTDIELETIAQTWSEHCSHKTFKSPVVYRGPDGERRYDNLLRETIFAATETVRQRLGNEDWCVSVFRDNAGIVRFDDRYHVCFKVETHNHPSAIEPYGGANTGLGGVIRDVLGTGLGGKPICNTDVFCFAPPDWPEEDLPPGVFHPRRVMRGVVAGVRDYGNRMGIPTVAGAVCFDPRYLANPLVFCGTVGLIPVGKEHKQPQAGDYIVVVGGRTGRDGIHGATFSSLHLTEESETVSASAVQIGNAITQKKMLDVLLAARDRGLYHAITDCGAGGFSSAIGEMAAGLGASVYLDQAPLKYQGLSYTEIWISESQERMILAVPPQSWPDLEQLCASEGVEAAVLGQFERTGRLRLYYQGQLVGDLDLHFLHEGRPRFVREAVWQDPAKKSPFHGPRPGQRSTSTRVSSAGLDYTPVLLAILSNYNVASKEWIIRQYDHEVQGTSVLKPLVGVANDGPGDAAVIAPVPGSYHGLAVACGINPRYSDYDPYWMAASAVDEALRNVVAVGADPSRVALLDNFCWGNTNRPEVLGALVRAAEGCRDAAVAFTVPFISGKDSLHNEFHSGNTHLVIPGTLLVSALGRVPDVRQCVSMDFKRPWNLIVLVGTTRPELAGSHLQWALYESNVLDDTVRQMVLDSATVGLSESAWEQVPRVDFARAPQLLRAVHTSIRRGLVRACHDLSEGGLAVALAEMAFAGGYGAEIALPEDLPPLVALFSESNTRFLLEVPPEAEPELREVFAGLPWQILGTVCDAPRLTIFDSQRRYRLVDASLDELKTAWKNAFAEKLP